MNVLFLGLVLTSLVTRVIWSPPFHINHHHRAILKEGHRFVIAFEEERNGDTEVLISQQEDSGTDAVGGFTSPIEFFSECKSKPGCTTEMTKNMVSRGTHEAASKLHSFEQQAKEVIDNAVGKVGNYPKGKLSEKSTAEAESVARNVKTAVGKMPGMFKLSDSAKGALKDSMVKMQNWDAVDSPKRIGEDIEQNASRKVEQGVEVVNETVETVKETNLTDHLQRSRKLIRDVLSSEKIRAVISWCHLLGVSTAYGMGIWVTFFSRCVLGKCNLPNQQFEVLVNKMNMVHFRAMAYCVGAAGFGYVMSQGRRGVSSDKMDMFQGFNLVYALCMILTNLIFLEPRATKLMVEIERMKMETGRGADSRMRSSVVAEELKKLNTYSSTMNVSTTVVLTWHLAFIGRLIQARY